MPSILVVDDHEDIRRLLSVTLGKNNELLEADNAVDALQIIAQKRPKIVLLDVMMPGAMDGLDVLKAIKSDPSLRATRVAMLSARGQGGDVDRAVQDGADAYFIKPFSPLEVVSWVRDNL